jgi:hypothetical protein
MERVATGSVCSKIRRSRGNVPRAQNLNTVQSAITACALVLCLMR